jgi:dihydroorotate dehydrogenase electron transfer subunit
MKNHKTIVLSNQEISSGYYRMRILAPNYNELVKPGQFIMFRVQRLLLPLLRRPFGIFRVGFLPADCDTMPPKEFIEIVYKVVGSGTEIMQGLSYGDPVELLGPLGQGFELGKPDEEKILVGGGIGLAPLYMLAEKLVKTSKARLFTSIICLSELITMIASFATLNISYFTDIS